MRILYAVQATGNGHVSRAITLLPHLEKKGTVDVFLSGSNCHLNPQLPIRFRSKGISLYYNNKGGLNYGKIAFQRNPIKVIQEAKSLPVEKYDLVINDFEFITSLSCMMKKVPSIHFGHQASFHYQPTPRPTPKSWHGELLLNEFVQATHHIGLHFDSYHPNIYGPIIKEQFLTTNPTDGGHITVYLPAVKQEKLQQILLQLPAQKFEIFSKEVKYPYRFRNLFYYPIDQDNFNKSLISCSGIICGAGFETPAEAMQLGKKILAIPIEGQYEQFCNASALENMGVTVMRIKKLNPLVIQNWLTSGKIIRKNYKNSITDSLEHLFSLGMNENNTMIKPYFSLFAP